jgi:sugar O-acyltransferase (sialic acid O-acetyltransferase NeuD family)
MTRENLLLIGAGGHARACIDVIERTERFNIFGLIGSASEIGSSQMGYTVLGTDEEIDKVINSCRNAIITLGQIKSPDRRIALYEKALDVGFEFPTITSPTSVISRDSVIGAGTLVMNSAIIGSSVRIGSNTIINSGALVEHDSIIHDHTHVSTRAVINGGVTIGSGCFIGSGSVIKEGITVGDNSIVGMGQVLRHNLEKNSKFTGEN